MTEDWPVRPADRLFYAQEKAELEHLLAAEAERHRDLALYLLRPPIVLGPHTVGGKVVLPGPLAPLGRRLDGRLGRVPVPVPAPVPDVPVQFIHEDDVGSALVQCILGAGPPGAYNIAADDVLSAVDVAREIGVLPIPLPGRLAHATARTVARFPLLPTMLEWVEAVSHPAIMDTSRAKSELGWTPRHSALDAVRDTLSG
jgi:nucleoside-diphosphate-sugar epimerase